MASVRFNKLNKCCDTSDLLWNISYLFYRALHLKNCRAYSIILNVRYPGGFRLSFTVSTFIEQMERNDCSNFVIHL